MAPETRPASSAQRAEEPGPAAAGDADSDASREGGPGEAAGGAGRSAETPRAGSAAAPAAERPLSDALRRLLAAWPGRGAADTATAARLPADPLRDPAGPAGPSGAHAGAPLAAARRIWQAAWQRVALRAGAPGELGPPLVYRVSAAGCCDMRAGDRSRRRGNKREVRSAAALPAAKRGRPADGRPGDPDPGADTDLVDTRERAAPDLGAGWALLEARRSGGGWERRAYLDPGGEEYPTLRAAQEAARAAAEAAQAAAAAAEAIEAAAGCQTLGALLAWAGGCARVGALARGPGAALNVAAVLRARAALRGGRLNTRRAAAAVARV